MMRSKYTLGIEPIIAVVILVAVALAISIAVIGYLMGLFGGLVGGQPQISVTGVTTKVLDGGKKLNVTMYLTNSGTASDRLTKISIIVYGKANDINGSAVKGLNPSGSYAAIPSGFRGWVTFEISLADDIRLEAGDSVLIRLFFERSGQHTITAVATA